MVFQTPGLSVFCPPPSTPSLPPAVVVPLTAGTVMHPFISKHTLPVLLCSQITRPGALTPALVLGSREPPSCCLCSAHLGCVPSWPSPGSGPIITPQQPRVAGRTPRPQRFLTRELGCSALPCGHSVSPRSTQEPRGWPATAHRPNHSSGFVACELRIVFILKKYLIEKQTKKTEQNTVTALTTPPAHPPPSVPSSLFAPVTVTNR